MLFVRYKSNKYIYSISLTFHNMSNGRRQSSYCKKKDTFEAETLVYVKAKGISMKYERPGKNKLD